MGVDDRTLARELGRIRGMEYAAHYAPRAPSMLLVADTWWRDRGELAASEWPVYRDAFLAEAQGTRAA